MLTVDFLASHALAFVSCAVLLGLLVGSFLNVVIYRLPKMLHRDWQAQAREVLEMPPVPQAETFNLVLPNSCCPQCGHEIKPWENVPVISYLFLRGKCSNCKTPISKRYPLVELACGVLSGYIAWHFGFTWQTGAMLALTWGLLAMSLIDADHQILPDILVLPLLWLGLIVNGFGLFTNLEDALWGAIAGYLSLWSVYWLFKLITGQEEPDSGKIEIGQTVSKESPKLISDNDASAAQGRRLLSLRHRHHGGDHPGLRRFLCTYQALAVVWPAVYGVLEIFLGRISDGRDCGDDG